MGWLDGILDMFEQALEDGEGQGSLAYCSLWGLKEKNMIKLENNSRGGRKN